MEQSYCKRGLCINQVKNNTTLPFLECQLFFKRLKHKQNLTRSIAVRSLRMGRPITKYLKQNWDQRLPFVCKRLPAQQNKYHQLLKTCALRKILVCYLG